MQRLALWRIVSRSCTRPDAVVRQISPVVCRTSCRRPALCYARYSSHQSSAGRRNHVDTIFALSTPPGRSAIAIIRISGLACVSIYRALCPGKADPKPRYATVRKIYAPDQEDEVLDPSALILYFPQPHTATGEDVLELHVHGGPAIVQAVLRAIPKCQNVNNSGIIRFAEPGEFTKRAFLNDRLDLTQVEALGDTLAATTEQQRKLSVRGASGVLSKQYDIWRKHLLHARGELEALIDFSEDQHFDESTSELFGSVASQIKSLITLLETHVKNAVRGELLRSGISISLLGAPNAGKSSLLNRIVGREAAIVSQEAGTTRDVVEVGVDLGGYFCRFGDTAGLRTSLRSSNIGEVEAEGMRRAKARAATSDVVIVVLNFETTSAGVRLCLDPEVMDTAVQLMEDKNKVVVALNKIDLVGNPEDLDRATSAVQSVIPGLSNHRIFPISCHDNPSDSIQGFLQGLGRHFDTLTSAMMPDLPDQRTLDQSIWQESLGATERHRLLLEQSITSLQDFMSIADTSAASDDEADIVVAAEHLRSAAECLARITGRGDAGDVEEVLGVVFEKFCVGK